MMAELKSHGYEGPYYLQKFVETRHNIANMDKPKNEFDESRLDDTLQIVWR
ncbi:hypothetical protein [Hydrogenimonas sp.]